MPDPQLGYGQRGEAPIDAVNQYMRATPWYQELIRSFGQTPDNVHLNDQQKQQVIRAAQANGIIVDEGHNGQEVDDSGNFAAKSHALRNTIIVAGIAAATLATLGAAGVFSGAAGAAAGAVPESTLASLGGGVGAAAADVGAGALAPAVAGGAGLAGVEGGAAGLSSGALAGLGSGAMGATAVPGLAGGVASTAAGLGGAAANDAFDAAGTFVGDSTVLNATGGGGIGATLGNIAKSSWFPAAIAAGAGLGGAVIQSNASDKAAQLQADAAKNALDFTKSQAALEQKNFAPYLAAGTGALSKLSYGLGIGDQRDYTPTGGPASITPAGDPRVSPSSPAAQFITNTHDQPVQLRAPDGSVSSVPASQVTHYLQRGATLVSGQGGSLATLGTRTPPIGAQTDGMAVGRAV